MMRKRTARRRRTGGARKGIGGVVAGAKGPLPAVDFIGTPAKLDQGPLTENEAPQNAVVPQNVPPLMSAVDA